MKLRPFLLAVAFFSAIHPVSLQARHKQQMPSSEMFMDSNLEAPSYTVGRSFFSFSSASKPRDRVGGGGGSIELIQPPPSPISIAGAFTREENEKNDRPTVYVTCNLMGGIGNQIFQIATTLAYAWDYGAIAVFPELHQNAYKLPLHKEKIFFRLNSASPSHPFDTSYTEISWYDSQQIPFRKDQKLFGYFQSWRRFDHYREQLLEVLAPSEKVSGYLEQKYGDLISHPNTVGVHVRTFNEKIHKLKIHPFMGMEYYQKAMGMFPSDTLFVIFSDRINWCKRHFPQLGRPCVFIEENDEIEDLFLMSMMKHQIIPNSTFSWWAAWLNRNPEKIVIAPTSLMHPDLFAFPLVQPNDFFLPDWVLISPNYEEPYPVDMTDYDSSPWDGNLKPE